MGLKIFYQMFHHDIQKVGANYFITTSFLQIKYHFLKYVYILYEVLKTL